MIMKQTKIWDLPLRVFHWVFAICVVGSIATGKAENWALHERFGLTILGLLMFRFLWGFVGSETARFSQFLKGPVAVFQNVVSILRRDAPPEKGHSALGGWATMILLFVPLYLVGTGVFSTDGTLFDGPLAHMVSFETAEQFADLHHYAEPVLFVALLMHFFAMAIYYFWLKKNLIPPMISGGALKTLQKNSATADKRLTVTWQLTGLVLLVGLVVAAHMLTLLKPDLF